MTRTVKQVIDLLEENGWQYIGTKGDHHKFFKKGARRPIIVAGKAKDVLAEGTLSSILREAGLKDNM
ncbi:MAG: type II toxin-antitoxin system HicA family toxin [Bacteroidales bacterium]|nr:type II toxin-antitoxin system HicA family toxin [Bacteroidales bacterium]